MKRSLINNSFVFLAAVVVAFAGLRAVLGVGVAPTPDIFDREITLEQALATAQSQDKIVFAFATADWCGPCQVYKRGALVNPRVAQWVRANAVPVYIDVDEMPREAGALGVMALPSTMALTPAGELIGRIEGAVAADALLAWLDEARSRALDATRSDASASSADSPISPHSD